jgi:BirA family transcriptional regulator, biotin operon repressor / biotin---[acetyl-CoA-carboxylase] ligase
VQELDAQASVPAVLQAVALPLVLALKRFEARGFAAFCQAYGQRDLLRGQPVTTTQAGVAQGVAEGVDDTGALLVRGDVLHRISSGEVSVRTATTAAGAPGALSP